MKEIIQKYIGPTLHDLNHRYKSWEHCYTAFGNENESTDLLALHLGFYLASWGMYRGSSGLLWKDYQVHNKAVKILKDYYNLRQNSCSKQPEFQDVLLLVKELSDYYSSILYSKGKGENPITSTDTLISKIILGTLGCLPAFDRYFNHGLCSNKSGYLKIDNKSLALIWQNTKDLRPQIESVQEWVYEETKIWYPTMKIIDMYYWQKGFDSLPTSNK